MIQTAQSASALVLAGLLALAGCAVIESPPQSTTLLLSGEQEVPPVASPASGTGQITVAADRSVTGSITINGISASAAHIHEAPAGKNGPVIIQLTRTSANTFTVPSGARLSDVQYASYKAGNLYVNVHSAAHPSGELRDQLRPGL